VLTYQRLQNRVCRSRLGKPHYSSNRP